jgi:hypothetical protein
VKRVIPGLLFLLVMAMATPGQAQERILDYFSDIVVHRDGSMVVDESIEVRAEGSQIRRGIYRDFPTDYRDRLGNNYRVDFELLEVLRDGRKEPHHTERQSNGIRIYAGSANAMLQPGVYRYTFRYRTTRQLGYFENHDELYWNVTGNGWEFVIEKAGARITLPEGVPISEISAEGYTGAPGEQGQNYRAHVDSNGSAVFETTAPLPMRHGLTVVATWPKNHVDEPDRRQQVTWFLTDNQGYLLAVGGLLLLLTYYLIVWHRVGRDPEMGVIIPLYEPPRGYSPASMRFIARMGYDHQTFGAAIVNMAVKGYLKILEERKGTFTLEKTGETVELAPGESALANALFQSGSRRIRLEQTNHKRLSRALDAHKASLKRDYEKNYFVTNRGFLVPGVLLTLALLAIGLLSVGSEDKLMAGLFMVVWLSFWSMAVIKLLVNASQAWRDARGSGVGSYARAIAATVFAIPFLVGELVGIGILAFVISIPFALTLLVAIGIHMMFYEWLKAPTLAGQRLLRQVEGFKKYLSVAEKDELNFKHPVEKTPALFEAYLPYALALDVGQQWAERFSAVLAAAGQDGASYQPRWYSGRSWSGSNLSGFTSSMSSAMGSAISSASTAPGSSSGSGGGGSSGGGGGGGGGGGW